MKAKHKIINKLIDNNILTDYLELGFGDGSNFKQIDIEYKISVDINGKGDFKGTTDDFFEQNESKFDCVFIDACHKAESVRNDIINSLKVLDGDGFIILHDSLPRSKAAQEVPQIQSEYCGTVWRAVVGFMASYPEIKVETYRADYGLTVIQPKGKKVRKHFEDKEMSFDYFQKNAKELINIVD